MKEKGLKDWLEQFCENQQLGKGEARNSFPSPREKPLARAQASHALFVLPGSWWVREHSWARCTRIAPEISQSTCSADKAEESTAQRPHGRARMTQDRGRSYRYCICGCSGSEDTQTEANHAALGLLLEGELIFRLWNGVTGMQVSCASPFPWLKWTTAYHEQRVGVFWANPYSFNKCFAGLGVVFWS